MRTSTVSMGGRLFRLTYRDEEGRVEVENGSRFCGFVKNDNNLQKNLNKFLKDICKKYDEESE